VRRALVVGCASNVWDDVKAAQALCSFDRIYCVKLSGVHWPLGDFTWAGLHPEFMDAYEAQRRHLGNPGGYEIVAPLSNDVGAHGAKGNITRRVSYRWPGMAASASSGIYGAKVALDDGHERIVLAGIPMTADDGHFTRGKVWADRNCFILGFHEAIPHLRGKVRSMSGYTREKLGVPDREWLGL
jgi:hypothetical protein